MKYHEIVRSFSTARIEQASQSYSVRGRFVVPLDYYEYDLRDMEHSTALQGGRGCGKTTYIRHFSHWTQFDSAAESVSSDALKCVVLYWKPETVFFRTLFKGWLDDELARDFFLSLVALEVLKELFSAINNIGHHFHPIERAISDDKNLWTAVSEVLGESLTTTDEVLTHINALLYRVRSAVRAKKHPESALQLEISSAVDYLIPIITSTCDELKKTRFVIFVDEFENLSDEQQGIINGYRKGSNARFTWSVAFKRYARVSANTDGNEKLNKPDDFQDVFMEDVYGFNDSAGGTLASKSLFTSEIFLLTLLNAGLKTDIESLSSKNLEDPSKISLRRTESYGARISDLMARLLPAKSHKELALDSLNNISAVNRLVRKAFSECLKDKVDATVIDDLFADEPDVAIASWLIFRQKTFKTSQFIGFINRDPDEYDKYKERVRTYVLTAMLALNKRYAYINIPIYSGFNTFCKLANWNIRHFTELCHRAFIHYSRTDPDIDVERIEDLPPLSAEDMHNGAIDASSVIVEDAINYAPHGKALDAVVKRLGHLFSELLRNRAISEPERVSFSIKSDQEVLGNDIDALVASAKCWRVLEQQPITRDRRSGGASSAARTFNLNPIYAPYFGISYTKGRTLEISLKEFMTVINGDPSQFEAIVSKYVRDVAPDSESDTPEQNELFRD